MKGLQKIWQWVDGWLGLRTFWFHWALVVLMAWVIPKLTAKTDKPGEFYPFSNFPMYSSFGPDTYLVFVTDLEDQPVAIGPTFGIAASDLKKNYDRKLGVLKSRAPKGARKMSMPMPLRNEAAAESLRWLVSNVSQPDQIAGLGGLRLHQVDILFRDDVLSQEVNLVGEIELP